MKFFAPWTSQPQFSARIRREVGGCLVRGFQDVANFSTPPTLTGTVVRAESKVRGKMRGFYSTIGAGTTDKLDTGITGTNSGGVSYLFIASQLSTGGSGFGRVFSQNDGNLWTASASSNLSFSLSGGNTPFYTVPQLTANPTVNVITYAGGTANPKLWRDGVAQTVTYASGTRSGALQNLSQSVILGNRAGGDRGHDGAIGLFVQFDGVLADDIACTLSVNPWALFLPLPRRYYPEPVAAAGGFLGAWARGSTTLVGGGVYA